MKKRQPINIERKRLVELLRATKNTTLETLADVFDDYGTETVDEIIEILKENENVRRKSNKRRNE